MSVRRRPNGEGTIFFNETRNRWEGSIDLGPRPGGGRNRPKATGKTRSEVAAKLADKRERAKAALPVTDVKMTVAELLDRWLDTAAAAKVEPGTLDTYRWAAEHVKDGVGFRKIGALTTLEVEALLGAKSKTLNKWSLIKVRSVLSQSLKWAMRRDFVFRNVAEVAELPSDARPAREGRALTAEEAHTFITHAKVHPLFPLWLTQLCIALRPGEVAALSWDDVDLDEGVIHVRSSLRRDKSEIKGGPRRSKLVKTKGTRGRRSLGIPKALVDALRAHKEATATNILIRSPQWRDLVFTTERGTPIDPANLRRDLRAVVKAGGLGHLRPYDLRHSGASLLAAAGVPLEKIADLLGHDGLRMARLVYVKALAPTVDVAVDPMQDLLSP